MTTCMWRELLKVLNQQRIVGFPSLCIFYFCFKGHSWTVMIDSLTAQMLSILGICFTCKIQPLETSWAPPAQRQMDRADIWTEWNI